LHRVIGFELAAEPATLPLPVAAQYVPPGSRGGGFPYSASTCVPRCWPSAVNGSGALLPACGPEPAAEAFVPCRSASRSRFPARSAPEGSQAQPL